ncbi:SHOCT domain-containing protein [Natronolimnobius baerhuensis]|uniref:SHOCT domain-containing protein n=1 Tax=Natronolimnobius baerhuensis TaxID=253108 RepID=A0A202E3Q1_9EURY|nr:SHOCT domain-containing protein [Natronolimnobius baerhuensis]OVE82859.1 hypothetical protein B2G88_18945 [Natronolimnobius baerhuensis]
MTTDDSLVRTLLIVIVAILLFPLLAMALMMPLMGIWGGGHMWNGMWNGSDSGWMWLLMGIIPLIVLFGIGSLLYSAVRQSNENQSDPAIQELRSAYARGELTEEEFEKRRERLERDR